MPREQQHPDPDQGHAEREDPPGADARREAPGEGRGDDDRAGHRQEAQPGLDRREAEHLLEVERDEVPHREHAAAEQEADEVGRCEGARAEDPQRDERSRRAALDEDEERQQGEARPGDRERRGRRPAVDVGAHDGEGQQHEAGGDRQRSRQVEVALAGDGPRALRDEAHRAGDAEKADRHVDEEDPLPAQQLGEHAAEQDARRSADGPHRAPVAECAVALVALFEGGGDDRQRGRARRRRRPGPARRAR